MSVVQIEAQVSSEELVKAAAQLNTPDLDAFAKRILILNAQRKAPSLSAEESALFAKINRGFPLNLQQHYEYLIERRKAEQLTPDEYQELLQLTQQTEQFDVERVEALAQLAKLRNVSLAKLMQDLKIVPPPYV